MGMKQSKKRALLAASGAGLLAVTGFVSTPMAQADDVSCYGVNKCKGTGDCGGKGHSCAGMNACKGQGYVKTSAEVCDKIGGSTTEPAA